MPSPPLTWTQPVFQAAGAGDPEGAAKCPALVILGEQDLPHIKEIANLLVNGISRAKLVTIPRAGHMVNLDAHDAFNQAVESFLASR